MKKFMCAVVIVVALCSFAYGGADLDLSGFNSIMAYSGLFDVLANPSAYMGKVIRLKGYFDVYHEEKTGKTYFGVIISDPGACCMAGLNFELKASYKYPQDYPKAGDVITVSGTFAVEHEGEDIFCKLEEADIL